jgi:hypothetical protein
MTTVDPASSTGRRTIREVIMLQSVVLAVVLVGAAALAIVGLRRREPTYALGRWLDPDEWFPDFSPGADER